MKIIFQIQEELAEDEIHIHCHELNEDMMRIQKLIQDKFKGKDIVVFKEDVEYYIPIQQVLFIETSLRELIVHTESDMYVIKKKLYELEAQLPDHFTRISKSALVNLNKVYAINRSIVSSGLVEFQNTSKKVAVSRMYYQEFKEKMKWRRSSL
ncbi:MAG: LytTR family DNA-binding domain-containing protein [Erysipelotrichaceae bacterium]